MRQNAICHPNQFNTGNGLCRKCYHKKWMDTHPESRLKLKISAKKWMDTHPIERKAIYRKSYYKDPERSKRKRMLRVDKIRTYNLKYQHGLTPEQYITMLEKQNGVCAICEKPNNIKERRLYVDHDHITGATRELLCQRCNAVLGSVVEDIEILEKMIAYLKKHRKPKLLLVKRA